MDGNQRECQGKIYVGSEIELETLSFQSSQKEVAVGSKVVIKEGNRLGSLGPRKSPGQTCLGDEHGFSSPDIFLPDAGSGILKVLGPPGYCNLSAEHFGPPIFPPCIPLASRSRAWRSDPGALRRSPRRLRVPELGAGSEGSESLLPRSQLAAGTSTFHAFHWVMRSLPGLESIPIRLSWFFFF